MSTSPHKGAPDTRPASSLQSMGTKSREGQWYLGYLSRVDDFKLLPDKQAGTTSRETHTISAWQETLHFLPPEQKERLNNYIEWYMTGHIPRSDRKMSKEFGKVKFLMNRQGDTKFRISDKSMERIDQVLRSRTPTPNRKVGSNVPDTRRAGGTPPLEAKSQSRPRSSDGNNANNVGAGTGRLIRPVQSSRMATATRGRGTISHSTIQSANRITVARTISPTNSSRKFAINALGRTGTQNRSSRSRSPAQHNKSSGRSREYDSRYTRSAGPSDEGRRRRYAMDESERYSDPIVGLSNQRSRESSASSGRRVQPPQHPRPRGSYPVRSERPPGVYSRNRPWEYDDRKPVARGSYTSLDLDRYGYDPSIDGDRSNITGFGVSGQKSHSLPRNAGRSRKQYPPTAPPDSGQRPVFTQQPAYERDGFERRADNDYLFDLHRGHVEYLLDQSNTPVTGDQYEPGADYILMMRRDADLN